jgi:hypothetical protein
MDPSIFLNFLIFPDEHPGIFLAMNLSGLTHDFKSKILANLCENVSGGKLALF